MKATNFEEMLAWQKARILDNKLFELFGSSKNFCFRDQILRASISIMNNIAEGFERKTNNEFTYFLYVSKGSTGEVRSMLYLALDRKYITQKEYEELSSLCTEISKLLYGFIKTL